MRRRKVPFKLGFVILTAVASGCGTTDPLRSLLLLVGPTPELAERTFEQDADDPCLRVLTSDPLFVPTYDEVLFYVESLAWKQQLACDALGFGAAETGTCCGGEFLFIENGTGLTGHIYFFDPVTRRLAAERSYSDALLGECPVTYFIQRVDFTNPIVTRSLCPWFTVF